MSALAAAIVIAPWTLRNERDLHRFVPVSTETGNTLAGMYDTASLRHHARWLEPRMTGAYRAIYHHVAGAQLDGALVHAVVGWVADHPTYPGAVLAWNGGRLLGFDGPAWAAMSLRTMSLGGDAGTLVWLGTLLVTLGALAALWRARERIPKTLIVLVAALLLPAAAVNGEMRLAVPLQAFLAILAAGVLAPARRTGTAGTFGRLWARLAAPGGAGDAGFDRRGQAASRSRARIAS